METEIKNNDLIKTVFLYTDTNKNIIYVLVDDRSVFEYTIETETWLYICKYEDWESYCPSLGITFLKKRRTNKIKEKTEHDTNND